MTLDLFSTIFLAATDAAGEIAPDAESGQPIHLIFGLDAAKFIAQLIIFFVVFMVLKKYAFGPVTAILEERRRRVEESMENAEKIKQQLEDAEQRHEEILEKANNEAKRLVDEARNSSAELRERRSQEAIREAEQIITRANEATRLEREKMYDDLKKELGRLVADTTGKVIDRSLNDEDKQRLNQAATEQIAGNN